MTSPYGRERCNQKPIAMPIGIAISTCRFTVMTKYSHSKGACGNKQVIEIIGENSKSFFMLQLPGNVARKPNKTKESLAKFSHRFRG